MLDAWHEATGLWIRDGYGQTETGQLTGMPLGDPGRGPGSMGSPLPGVRLDVDDGELVADPSAARRSSCAISARSRRAGDGGAPATG